MGKVLNLRKKSLDTARGKPIKAPQPLPKPREEVKAEPKVVFEEEHQSPSPRISWQAPSFYYNPQKRYLSLIIMALLAGAVALLVFRHDALTAIFLFLSSMVLLLYSSQKPTISKITIDQLGVSVDDVVYYYKDLKSFWIEYNPGGPKELSLESAKWYMPYVKVMLNEQDPIEVRSLVVNFLPEKEHENSIVDHLGRRLGL